MTTINLYLIIEKLIKQLTDKLGEVTREKECLEDLLKNILLKSELAKLK